MVNEDHNLLEEKVGKLLGTLKRVAAPGDFDFRVRALIAKGKPAVSGSWLPASVRFAVPLALALLVGGYFALNSLYSSDGSVVAEIAQPVSSFTETRPPAVETSSRGDGIPLTEAREPDDLIVAKAPSTDEKVPVITPEKRLAAPVVKREQPGGGSFDEASRMSRTILTRGPRDVRMPARNVLMFIGVAARFTGGVWRVESVTPNNVGGRSGVMAGDVIEAVNGQALTETRSFENNFSGKSLTVRRDGKSIQIELKP